MFENLFNSEERCIKKYHLWHWKFNTWMNSISKSDIETLKCELEAIQYYKNKDTENKYYTQELELLEAHEAIVKRIIEEAEKVPALEARIKELERTVFELNSDLINIKTGRSTLKEFKERMAEGPVNCKVALKDIKIVNYRD